MLYEDVDHGDSAQIEGLVFREDENKNIRAYAIVNKENREIINLDGEFVFELK